MHLQTARALPADAGLHIGYADYVTGATITGWAVDLRAIGAPAVLHATIDGAPVGEVRCALAREDVRAAGIPGDVGGFRYVLPADFLDGRRHALRLAFPSGAAVSFPAADGSVLDQHVFRIGADDAAAGCTDMLDVLRRCGIRSADFVSRFDVGDYLALNSGAGLSSRSQCVGHFARFGRVALCPISVAWRFEPDFYAELTPEAAGLAPEAAYLHWLNIGLADGVRPNRSLFLKDLGLTRLDGMPPGFDPALYRALNPDVGGRGCWGALQHAVEHGIAERRDGCPRPADNAELHLAAADRLAVAGRLDAARRVYEAVLAAEPAHPAGLQHYADCLLRQGAHYAAEQAYLRVLAAGAGNVWTELNLAKCRRLSGRSAEAARGLAGLRNSLAGDMAVASELQSDSAAAFQAMREQARRRAALGFIDEGRALMAQAAALLIETADNAQPPGPRRAAPVRAVAILADMSLPQCRFYRVEQKAEHLAAAGFAVQVFDQARELDAFAEALPFVDAVIFYRLAATPEVVNAIAAASRAGVATFYDIDDPVFDGALFPDSLSSYGGLVSAEEYGDLATGVELFGAAMSLCDYGLASTPTLAALMRKRVRSGQVFVHANALGAAHLRHVGSAGGRARERPVRIFYGTGTRAGNDDFDRLAAPALDRLLQSHGAAIELVIMGHLSLPPCLARHAARIRRLEPVWDLDSYWTILATMDASLAVLKDSTLSDCKSEIKWLEAAMLGIASVVSPTATYRAVVGDGVTGLLAATPEGWFAALDRLVREPALRETIGQAARAQALAQYGVARSAANLRAIMARVRPKRAAARRRRRVLVVNVFFPPQDIGGATRVVADNVRDLMDEHGDALDIEVFTTTEGGTTPYAMRSYSWNGVRVTAVTAGDGARPDWEPDDPRMAEQFGRVLDRMRPDLVHFHCIQRLTGAVCRAARARAIPYLVTVHDGWWISDHQFLLDDALQPALYRHADPSRQLELGGADSLRRMTALGVHLAAARHVLAVSDPFARLYRSCGFANVSIVANGVPDFALAPRTCSPDGRVRLAHVGGAAPHKGFNLLRSVLATEQYRNLSLTVIDQALAPGMQTTDLLGTTPVRTRARVRQAEIGSLYAEIDVLAAPSLWPESYGLVAREALRAGCWVIASDRGAMALDVTPDNGFVVDVGSAENLRAVLARIDADPERYLRPPAPPRPMRHSREQARELARLYLPDSEPLRPAGAAATAGGNPSFIL